MSTHSWAFLIVLPLFMACGARPGAQHPAASVTDDVPVYGPALHVVPFEPVAAEATAEPPPVAHPRIPASSDEVEESVVTYRLRRGESLAHFARWAELPVEVIAEASDLPLDEPLAVGTTVRVPADHDRRSRIELARDEHHVRRAEGYLASRGGAVGTDFHVVRTGETAWSIAKGNGELPVWLVETFNPSLDLDGLRPGQAVMLPVTADMIDDAPLDELHAVGEDTDERAAGLQP